MPIYGYFYNMSKGSLGVL